MSTATLPDLDEATERGAPTPCRGFQRLPSGDLAPCPDAARWDLIVACEHAEAAGPYCDVHHGRAFAGFGRCRLGHRVVLIAAMPLTG